jgi:CelD/BcsL family acetyltransferase involved in cellulose biosynthesis
MRAVMAEQYEVEELDRPEQFEALRDEWAALLERAEGSLFQTWEWQWSWWQHFGRGRLCLLTARREGRLAGIAPLMIGSYFGLPLRRLQFIGTMSTDYLDLILARGEEAALVTRFVEEMAARQGRWDLVDLQQIRGHSPLAQATAPPPCRTLRLHQERCPFVALPHTWEEFSGSLGKSLRKNIGYYRRLMEREHQFEIETVTNGSLPEAMEEFFALHQARWRRRHLPGAFAGARIRQFHHEFAARCLERGWLRLHRLRLDGRTGAVLYCFNHGGKGYYYQGGFEPALSRYSPGTVLTAHAIEDAIRLGAAEFDFLRGDEPYKYAWKATDRENVRLLVWRPAFPSRLAPWLNRLERRVEHGAKAVARRLQG